MADKTVATDAARPWIQHTASQHPRHVWHSILPLVASQSGEHCCQLLVLPPFLLGFPRLSKQRADQCLRGDYHQNSVSNKTTPQWLYLKETHLLPESDKNRYETVMVPAVCVLQLLWAASVAPSPSHPSLRCNLNFNMFDLNAKLQADV